MSQGSGPSGGVGPSGPRTGIRLLCAVVALAAALCAMGMISGPSTDMTMPMPTSSSGSVSAPAPATTAATDHDRLAPIGCEGTCAGDATTACAASVLVAMVLLPLAGRGRSGYLHLGPRGPTSAAAPPGAGRLLLARHVAAPSLLGVLRV